MRCLIDADVLLHELGWSGQFKDKETGEEVLFNFEKLSEMLDKKIEVIQEDCGADQAPVLFVSSSDWIVETWNRKAAFTGKPTLTHRPNFREAIAVTKPYKGNRNNPKPFHYKNLFTHMLDNYEVVVSQDGLEADDELCIWQRDCLRRGEDTTICSRDKDLRICQGWHYSWECGQQASLGPVFTDSLGWLEKTPKGKIIGYGLTFFLFQLLVGDSADNIPGLKGSGDAKAWELLSPLCLDKAALIKAVKEEYKRVLGGDSKTMFLEQASLLWMIQERYIPFNIKELR